MLHIVCLKAGTKYGPEYVNILYDMVSRNLPEGFDGDFTCFTDDISGLSPSIATRPLPHPGLNGWWNKIALFKPGLFPDGDQVLYFDLDTVITGPLDEIASYRGDFAILRDFYRPDGLQSSVMSWRVSVPEIVWDAWSAADCPQDFPEGDQFVIEQVMCECVDIWQDLYPGQFASYKVHASLGIPKGANVVVFHGEPRPHECGDWVPYVWKVGGGVSASLVFNPNVPLATIKANIASTKARGAEWLKASEPHEGEALIVAGGPSMKVDLPSIAARARGGAAVFGINNAAKFLLTHGLCVNAQVISDARPENCDFVLPGIVLADCFFASQCDPSVLDAAADRLTCFQLLTPEMEPNEKDMIYIGGGTTAGLHAIVIAYVLGYRKIHLYGFDSCYEGDENHAYKQPLNDGERIIETIVGGQTFRCAPWMIAQADDFKGLIPQLVGMGCEIHVHGTGLIPHIAKLMVPGAIDGELKLIDGIWWPNKDQYAAPALNREKNDIPRILHYVPKRDVVVQAGGNVGIGFAFEVTAPRQEPCPPLRIRHRLAAVVQFEGGQPSEQKASKILNLVDKKLGARLTELYTGFRESVEDAAAPQTGKEVPPANKPM